MSDWRASAACAGRDTRWWFVREQSDPVAAGLASRLCSGCVVRRDCAAEALALLDDGETLTGTWAGVWVSSSPSVVARLELRARA